jgi:hypothetical protein
VALNSNCNKVGGCEKTSPQGKWLRNNLANTTNKRCILAYFHHPLYSTGNNIPNPNVKPLWQILYNNGAEVIVNGHAHRYERYALLTPQAQQICRTASASSSPGPEAHREAVRSTTTRLLE